MVNHVNLKESQHTAFVRGFWKGMAAPVMLFGSTSLPVEARPIEFQQIPRRQSSPASDWVRVGDSLRAAVRRYREDLKP